MENLKSFFFVVALVVSMQSNIFSMDTASKQKIYSVWTMKERQAVLADIERNNFFKKLASDSDTDKRLKSSQPLVYSIDHHEHEQNTKKMIDLRPEQKQQKRAEIIANLSQQKIPTLQASTLMEWELYKKLQENSGMSGKYFKNMTKDILKSLPDLLIHDDL